MPRRRDAVGNSTIDASLIAADEIANEVHELADHSRDLQEADPVEGIPETDLEEHEEEVWFDAEALAAASTVHLSERRAGSSEGSPAPVLREPLVRAPAIGSFATASASSGISLACLPGWPDAGPSGQGLGGLAGDLVGDLRPGDLAVLGASQRGVGRSGLLAQLGDGLALSGSPVVFVSADPPRLWRARTLARWFGIDARTFVEAEWARREPRLAAMLDEFSRGPWAAIDERQRFVAAKQLCDRAGRGSTLAALQRWRRELGADEGPASWPIVIVDPVEELGEPSRALAELGELAVDEQLIVLLSCDLFDEHSTRARTIDGIASVRLHARAEQDQTLELELCHRRLGPRGQLRLRWHRPSGRFSPAH